MERDAVLWEIARSNTAQGFPHETEGQIHTRLHGPKENTVNNDFIVALLTASAEKSTFGS